MTACADRHRLLARRADEAGPDAPSAEERAELVAHLAGCLACRSALDEQRLVAAILRSRPALAPSPAFARQLASRLDDASGWLGILDWRVWTFRLAPVAVALALAAFFAGTTAAAPDASAATLEAWTRSVGETSSMASAVWQEGTSSDTLVETLLTGRREASDAR
jgi:hypothetical protein